MEPYQMLLPKFQFSAPGSLEEACRLLAEGEGKAAVIAGGTDLLVKMKQGRLSPELVVSIARLGDGQPPVEPDDGLLRIQPLATMTELGNHRDLRGTFRSIAEGALAVGSPQIRNRATVGGNLVSARPCADTAPPLLCWDARLDLASAKGIRTVELSDFFMAPGRTLIRPDEIMVSIDIERPREPAGGAFLKLIRRATREITIVSAAVSLMLDRPGGSVTTARIALGSVAPVPLRAIKAEELLRGERASGTLFAQAAATAAGEAVPIDDFRGSAAYRREMVEVLVRRALEQALSRAGEGQ
jgi:CO/xanthine dehydrogenase FAD-binding subunit